MTTGMPELGSKISLISKADIRYEGRLFTVDPQECTIALASVRSFGTEDRETQYPVPAQNQVYDYILFRGTDIKDIRVINNVSHPQPLNDPAIMQLSVPPTLGGQTFQSHPVLGPMGPQMGQFGGAYGGMGAIGTIGTGAIGTSLGMQSSSRSLSNSKPTSVLDLIGGSRSTTPASLSSRKSPTIDQGVQAGGSSHNEKKVVKPIQPPNQKNQRRSNENRDTRGDRGDHQQQSRPSGGRPQQYNAQHNYQHQQSYSNQGYQQNQNHRGNWVNNRGPMRMRGRTRGTGYRNNPSGNATRPRNTLKFENDYDFEQANTEFEELRSQLGKVKIDEAGSVSAKSSDVNGDVDKKDDSGNETGAGEAEQDEEHEVYYDKSKSFFDKISCEAVERAKGKSQRTDWRVERKLNSETFGVAAARRGSYRGRGGFRGMGYRGGYRPNYRQQSQQNNQQRRAAGPSNENVQSSQQISQQQQQQGNRSDQIEKPQPQENIHNDTDSVKKIVMQAIDLPPECSQAQAKSSDSIGNVPEPAMAGILLIISRLMWVYFIPNLM
ncbi:protein LSM14 homolog B-A isoform X2 [Diorhabda carinulata]|uniref:protein LSM14 homolog B-A isoform X2 n=1 Tax=Diorhabda carinulata TaxID=1163345 RepID=UPI0025A1F287|nr:protein LSM14 homolog B-A isoform X2 [Diorhabda carinulata]